MRWLIRIILLLVALICGLAGFLAYRVMDARAQTPALIAAALAKADPDVLTLPPERVAMYLKVEDPTFWTNDGVDLKSPGAGQTTTTQGLGKLIFFAPFKPGYWNKLQLILMSKYALTQKASKKDIFTAALTLAWMGEAGGRPVTGFAEAARTYFGKPLAALTDDEFLALTAMQLGPDRYDPVEHPEMSAERVGRMKRLIAGACVPAGLNDVGLEGCKG